MHDHPFHVMVLSALGMVPAVPHQAGFPFGEETGFVDECAGEADPLWSQRQRFRRRPANRGIRETRVAYDALLGTAAGRPFRGHSACPSAGDGARPA